MKTKKKKYSLGTGRNGVVKNYIESPNETLVENEISMAKARQKADSNVLSNGLSLFGNLAMQYGLGMTGGTKGAVKGVGQGFGNMFGGEEKALGGPVKGANVEVEGEEVGETPDGQLLDFKGPSHENGGMDVNLPEGTEIFSKRITVKGKTMAERKLNREKKEMSLQKLLEKNSMDSVLKNSLKRTKETNAAEEAEDQSLQEMIGKMQEMVKKYGFGTGPKGIQKFADGGKVGPGGIKYGDPDPANPADPYHYMSPEDFLAKSQNYLTTNAIESKPTSIDFKGIDKFFSKDIIADNASLDGDGVSDTNQSFDSFAKNMNRTNKNGEVDNASKDSLLPGEENLFNLTGGDILGLAGTAYSTFAPMDNTNKNRAGDTPNINAFKDYGNDALDSIDNAKGYIAGQRDKALSDIETSRNRITINNRNSARGVNTQRALDLASEVNANKAEGDVYDSFAKNMMSLLSQQAGFEDKQDQMVMTGEQQKDLNDRADRDNYYSQLAQDIATKGEGIQVMGKMLNENKSNTMAEKAVNDSSINFKYENGVLTDKVGNTVMTRAEVEKAAKALKMTATEYIELLNKRNNG